MPTYAIGDVQGCRQALESLLLHLDYQSDRDQLWFTGDLVCRGPDSLGCLRFIRSLSPQPIVVLGNHDLHLLALAEQPPAVLSGENASLAAILQAPDRVELLAWLRSQPLIHYDETFNCLLVHAGIPPSWDLSTALQQAQAFQQYLQGNEYPEFLTAMYGDEPADWSSELSGMTRWRYVCNALTRLRVCDADGKLDLQYKGALSKIPEGKHPWFAHPLRQCRDVDIIFGHWAALRGTTHSPRHHAIDTGYVWGGALTALRLEDKQRFQVQAPAN